MNQETLKKANELVAQGEALEQHKKDVMRYTNGLKNIGIAIIKHNDGNYHLSLKPELFVIDAPRQMQFYMDALDKRIAEVKAEIEAL